MTKRRKACPACGLHGGFHALNCVIREGEKLAAISDRVIAGPAASAVLTPPKSSGSYSSPENPLWRRTPILIGVILFVIQIAAIVFAAGSIKSDIEHLQQDMNEMKQWRSRMDDYMRDTRR